MIDIQNFSITKTIFESDSFSIYQVNEKNNPNLLISKVIKQPITDEEMIIKEIEFFLTIHHPSFLPLVGFSLTDFHKNPYLTVICDDLSCISYSEYKKSSQFTEDSKSKIYLASLSLYRYFKLRHSKLINFTLNEFIFSPKRSNFPFVIYLSYEFVNDTKDHEIEFLHKLQKELEIQKIPDTDDNEFKKSLFFCLNSEETADIQRSIDGDIDKCLHIGQLFYQGDQNFPKNEEEGIHFLKAAADRGNTEAQVLLTSIFNDDPNMQQHALHYCIMAAKSGHFGAISNLGVYFLEGKIVERNEKEAAKLFKLAAKKGGIIQAVMNYAYCLSEGVGVEKNVKKSKKYYKIAADKGVVQAMVKYGELEDDKRESIQYFKIAADKGVVQAMVKYGELVDDKRESIQYFKMAADLGSVEALVDLADLSGDCEYYKKAADLGDFNSATKYAFFEFQRKNFDVALKYFELAAENNDPTAIYNYSILLSETNKLNKSNAEKVVKFYRSAIQKGDIQSMLNLAELFEEGNEFIPQNFEEAKKLYKLASDCGNSDGSLNCGRILEEKSNDIKSAIKFYQKAAENGNVEALVPLARALLKIGGDRDLILQLIEKSVEYGNPEGMFLLGMMYAEGKLVEKNKEKARKLLVMADENGFETESPTIQEIIDNL